MRQGILILRVIHKKPLDINTLRNKFRSLVINGVYGSDSYANKFESFSKLMEISIGKFRLLINGGIDAIDENSKIVEVEANDFMKTSATDKELARRSKITCLRMLETGAETVLQPDRILTKAKCKISRVYMYSLEEVISKANKISLQRGDKEKSIEDALNRIHEVLIKLQENIDNGRISSDSDCFYKLTFKEELYENDWMLIEKTSESDISDTVEYCSQKLYDLSVDPNIEQNSFLQEMKEINQRHFGDDLNLLKKCRTDVDKGYTKGRPKLKLLPRTVEAPINGMAESPQYREIFCGAKPISA